MTSAECFEVLFASFVVMPMLLLRANMARELMPYEAFRHARYAMRQRLFELTIICLRGVVRTLYISFRSQIHLSDIRFPRPSIFNRLKYLSFSVVSLTSFAFYTSSLTLQVTTVTPTLQRCSYKESNTEL